MPTLIPKRLKNWWGRVTRRKRPRNVKAAERAKATAFRVKRNTMRGRSLVKNLVEITPEEAEELPSNNVAYALPRQKNSIYQRLVGKLKGLDKPPTSAPIQLPVTQYPMFNVNERRTATIDPVIFNAMIASGTEAKVTKKGVTLHLEPLYYGKRRLYKYFLDKHNGLITEPLTEAYRAYATDEELDILFTKLRRFVQSHTNSENLRDLSEIVARDFFHTNLDALDAEIKIAEGLDQILTNPTGRQEFAQEYGSVLNRYLLGMMQTPRKLNYEADLAAGFCGKGIDETPPIDNFNSPLCICCFMSQTHLDRFLGSGAGIVNKEKREQKREERKERSKGCSNYIILNPEHFPSAYAYDEKKSGSSMTVPITAKKFLSTSFIIDAFREQGVETMDEDLFNVLKENPIGQELLEASKLFLLTASEYAKHKNYERYMVFKDEALPEKFVVCYKDPLKIAAVRRAMQKERRFLYCDPYTAYCIKKKNRELWNQAFGVKISATRGKYYNIAFDLYDMLNSYEKFFIDFFQHRLIFYRWIRNNTSSMERKLTEASEVYREPINTPDFLDFISRNVKETDFLFQEFKKQQEKIRLWNYEELEVVEDGRPARIILDEGKKIKKTGDAIKLIKKLRDGVVSFEMPEGVPVDEGNRAYVQAWTAPRRPPAPALAAAPRTTRRNNGYARTLAAINAALAAGPSPANSLRTGASSRTGSPAAFPPGYTVSPANSVRTSASTATPPPFPPGYGLRPENERSPLVTLPPEVNVSGRRGAWERPAAFPQIVPGTQSNRPGFGYNATRRQRNAAARAVARAAPVVRRNTGAGIFPVNNPNERRRGEMLSNLEMRLNRLREPGQPNRNERTRRIRKITELMQFLEQGVNMKTAQPLYNDLLLDNSVPDE